MIRFLRRDAKSPAPTPTLAPEAALARADALYAQGDALEAITLLTDTNPSAGTAAFYDSLLPIGNALGFGTRYTASTTAPDDTENATPTVSNAFTLTGSVNKDCSFYAGNDASARNIDFGTIGVRTGADVLKALALGAKAVLLGRPYVYGLGLSGADGVRPDLRSPACGGPGCAFPLPAVGT